jgi:hypothetical protein
MQILHKFSLVKKANILLRLFKNAITIYVFFFNLLGFPSTKLENRRVEHVLPKEEGAGTSGRREVVGKGSRMNMVQNI